MLVETAATRQVVVLTHDDRLPEAVRRLQLPAQILEVTRDAGSVVTVSQCSNPAERYLSDAWAVARDPAMPPAVVGKVVPELCRLALETTCRDVWFRQQLLAGQRRSDVEATWISALTTRVKVALAVTSSPEGSLDGWLSRGRRRAALGICTSAVHSGLRTDPRAAIDDVAHVVGELAKLHAR